MLHKHWGRIMVVAVGASVVAACARDEGDVATGDSATLSQTAGGDVAGAMISPAAMTAFLSTVNQGEIEAGQLAQEKATNAQVRQFAQMMVTDHRQAENQTGQTATGAPSGGSAASTGSGSAQTGTAQPGGTSGSSAGTPGNLPTVTADTHAKHEQLMTTLRNTPRGRGFDSTYIAAMVTGHEEVLRQLHQLRSGVSNATGGTMPTDTGARAATGTTQSAGTPSSGTMQAQVETAVQMVQRHLDRAQEIQRSLGGTR